MYKESANLGNAEACMALGNFYESDMYEKIDLDMAADYYKIAAEMNEPHALYKAGQLSEKGIYQYKNERETSENVLRYYEAAMEQGSVDATIRLAQIHRMFRPSRVLLFSAFAVRTVKYLTRVCNG